MLSIHATERLRFHFGLERKDEYPCPCSARFCLQAKVSTQTGMNKSTWMRIPIIPSFLLYPALEILWIPSLCWPRQAEMLSQSASPLGSMNLSIYAAAVAAVSVQSAARLPWLTDDSGTRFCLACSNSQKNIGGH